MKNQIKLVFLFVFIIFISGIAFSQNRWVKIYHDDQEAIGIMRKKLELEIRN